MVNARRDGRSGRRRGSVVPLFGDLLTAAAKTAAEHVAVSFEDRELTYGQLDERSAQLARELIGRGIGPGDIVAIAIARSIESVLAVWAVARTGAAFVPVDPVYPRDRIEFMLADSEAVLGLTTSPHRSGLGEGIEWLELDDPVVVQQVATRPTHPFWYGDRIRTATVQHPVYIIYTSGSTGRPKAVVVTSDGIARVASAQYGISATSRVTHLSSPSFDFSILEFLHTFVAGATLVVVPPAVFGGEELAVLLKRERITHLTITPGALESVPLDEFGDLRTVICAGDTLNPALVDRWTAAGRVVFNAYGPTETTVIVSTGPMTAGAPVTLGQVTEGARPLILDSRLRMVPQGVAGELYLAGSGLAQGYLGRPGLTGERFVANPLAAELGLSGVRMYRTGDLVRRTEDGALEYLGRSDFQVKIRGLRIELGEIDSALSAHPDVSFAVTLGQALASGTTALVSYVLARPDVTLSPFELAVFLSKSLPAYMVPASITVLDEIPLTPVGKLDRARLPEPVFTVREFRAPSTRAEEIVAEVFAAVLRPDEDVPVGAEDDFFELGGNSLLATQVAARLGAALGTRIPLHLVFEASTVAELAARVDRHVGMAAGEAVPLLRPMPRPERIPLSYAQQRMWFLNRFDPDSVVNNIPMAVRLSGRLDLDALRAAVGDLVERHEVLRTVYPGFDGEGYQVVLTADDLGAVPDLPVVVAAPEQIRELVVETFAAAFDVTARPPLRLRVLRIGDTEHVLVCVVHHIAGDGWSMRPLTRDLMTAYVARAAGEAPVWVPLPVQYADFSIWQRSVLGSEDDAQSLISAQAQYWRAALDGVPDELPLPFDRPRPATQSFAGGHLVFPIGVDLHQRLQEVAREQQGSLFMVLHAALALLLAGVSGTDDIAIGTPVAGRGEAALDDLVGMFVNTLVLRTRIRGELTIAELLAATRDTDLQAFAHADVPFERLVELLAPERSISRNPLFQVMLSFQNLPEGTFELPGLRVSGVDFENVTEKFDLSLTISEATGTDGELGAVGLMAEFSYATDLFDAVTVAGFADRYLRVLKLIAEDPQRRLGDIDLLDDAERSLVLHRWNATEYPIDPATLMSLFEAQVERTPDAVAVTFEGTSLSYGEFAGRVSRLARWLIASGVGPESLVALGMRRSVELVVGMYAVVASGGAYVPVDPDHPAERIAHILDTARPVCVLTTSVDGLELPETVRRVEIDTLDVSDFSDVPVTDADRLAPLRPDNTAYVIYTSGSTGRPKGVAVSHAAIVNRLVWMHAQYGLRADDVVLQKTPATFDVSVWEFFWPLQVGARLVVAKPDGHRDPAYLAQLILDEGVTTVHFVPSMLAVFVADPRVGECVGLRNVFASGEALPVPTAQRLRELTGASLHNLYGPTEAAVDVTFHEVVDTDTVSVPIGLPVFNTQVYVLDARLHPVAPGVSGELYLAGAQLARGYVRQAELTADRFVANPFTDGERMYRTGDLVRWTTSASGESDAADELEYLGRTDFQVKVRGLRIELGDIESALTAQESVAQSVVVVRDDERTGAQLVAYLVAADTGIDTDALRVTLTAQLPGYMVPAAFVVLDVFPLNASGKLDRKALPAPVFEVREFRAPVTPVQEIVAGVFADLLGVDRVGLDDDFFALGGNSLLAARAAARIGEAIEGSLAVRVLFEAPTVVALAARVEPGAGGPVRPKLVALARPERLPLSLAQQRMWTLNQIAPESPAYNIPLALRLTGTLDVDALRTAVGDVLERHESLRTRYPADAATGLPFQEILSVGEALPGGLRVRATADPLVDVTSFMSAGFDVTQQVPVRAVLLAAGAAELGEQEYLLAMVIHHIAGDGSSVAPLARDLMTAYVARSTGGTPSWAPLEIQYADYALWHRRVLGDDTDENSLAASQLAFWRGHLAGLSGMPGLPQDRPHPPMPSMRGAVTAFTVPEEVHRALDRIARERNATLFMVVHAAVAVLLARMCGRTDVAIGTPVAGRGARALDDLVGMFVNTLTLRAEVDGAIGFDALVDRIRETDLAALDNADIPFERVVEEVAPHRGREQNPLFQVVLAFQNTEQASLELPGLTIAGVDHGAVAAKFDLSIDVEPIVHADGTLGELSIGFNYATDVFDATTVAAFSERFSRVLAAVVADPRAVVGDIDVLGPGERDSLLVDWHAVGVPAAPVTLVDLIAEQAARRPDAVAVRAGDETLSFAKLLGRANQVARALIAHGVGPESRVAVAVSRTVELPVALLGVLVSGAGYVPIDTAYPMQRLEFMLADAAPTVVLTTAEGREALSGTDIEVVLLEDVGGFADGPVSDAERVAPLVPANLAYVIYTSGSTGVPKGVAVTHANVLGLYTNAGLRFDFRESDVWTMFHSFAFDFSVWELWCALASGAAVVVVDQITSRSPEQLRELLVRERVTVLNQTPSAFYQLAEADRVAHDADELALRYVVFGGEALDLRQLQRWYDRHAVDAPLLVNMYGITETTVHVSYQALDERLALSPASVIGRGLPGLHTYVLDHRLTPSPATVAGELYIAGAQLSRGYLGQPGLTATRFVANPFGPAGSLMYRSGDVGRWAGREDTAALEYSGRSDQQVQLRGFRIELGEIEAALSRLPGVAQAVALVRTKDGIGDRLIGYIVAEDSLAEALEPAALRSAVGEFLTGYMVPDVIVVIEALPLTPNGKLDRKALPAPEFVGSAVFRAPSTPAEQAISRVFAELLGVERVGLDDSFFELGGNSLLATQVAARLGAELGEKVPVVWFFTAATPAGLAAQLENRRSGHIDPEAAFDVLLPLRSSGSAEPLFCVHPLGGLAWSFAGLAAHLDADRPIYGLQSPALTSNFSSLPDSIQDCAQRYVKEIRTVQPQGPYHLLGWSIGGVLAHAMAVQLQSEGEQVALLAMMDSYLEAGRAPVDEAAEPGPVPFQELFGGLFGGVAVDLRLDEASDVGEIVEQLSALPEPFASLGAGRIDRIVRSNLEMAGLTNHYEASQFHGDLVYFTAAETVPASTPGVETWRSVVNGTIRDHPLPTTHWRMTEQASLARIGSVLNASRRTMLVARSTGGTPSWAPLEIQYADYALWHRRVLGDDTDENSLAASQLAFWRGHLAGLSGMPGLPQDRPHPPMPSMRGAVTAFTVPEEVHRALDRIARERNATLFMVVHAAVAVLLARMCGRTDVAIGTPVAGRGARALDDLVGMFVNTLTLRAEVDGAIGFDALVDRIRETDLAALDNADIPFERVVEEVAPHRGREQNPLFQVVLAFQNTEQASLELPGLTIAGVDHGAVAAKFDLSIDVEPIVHADGTLGELSIGFNYATDVFDATTVDALADRFGRVLATVAADPAAVVGDIDLLDTVERAGLLRSGTGAESPTDSAATLASLFQARVERTPDAVAVTFEGESLSYAEFAARANRLARHLISLGVGPDRLVALGMRRSLDLVIGMYAVTVAGGGYVPLDPDHPAERTAYVLATANPVCVLTTAADVADVSASVDGGYQLVELDALDLSGYSVAPVTDADRLAPLRPDNTAYVIYTSGSTGRPKGVAVSHAAIVNRLVWMHAQYGLRADDVVLQKTPATFDVSVWEFFWPLQVGARLVVAKPDGHRDPAYLAQLILDEGVTTVHFVPSMLAVFVADPRVGECVGLRNVFASGEALPVPTAQRLRELTGASLHNLYGPTEAAVDVTFHEVVDTDTVSVPIGLPVFNTQVYVLDARLHPVAPGVSGELYLAGAQLARGYVRQAELTADRFVANPFTDGERMYRTGDLVRWTAAGQLEYLGRTDFQVKLRGLRIELGEIESALAAAESVAQAVVVVRADERLGDQLVAYLVAVPDAEIVIDDVRSVSAQQLPTYMVPSAFVVLDAIPVNANGKLDRAALPAPRIVAREYRAPGTAQEQAIAKVFAAVLGVEQVGLDDDFFALGGNSLSGIRACAALTAELGRPVSVRLLFGHSNVDALATALRDGTEVSDGSDPAADAVLDASISIAGCAAPRREEPESILLTGATGFLGIFLLRELLERTTATVYCLVRAADDVAAAARIDAVERKYRVDLDAYRSRIVAVTGDLARPLLGLEPARFADLAERIDVIYHNGAQVNHLEPYARMRAANVGGTTEVLRLASTTRVKPVHYSSTVSVLKGTPQDDGVPDGMEGYGLSKWVAEQLVWAGIGRGIPTTIYRVGLITGDSRTGAAPVDDAATTMLRAMLVLGVWPAFGDIDQPMAPVDYVAAELVRFSRDPNPPSNLHYLAGSSEGVWSAFAEEAHRRGYRMAVTEPKHFVQAVTDAAEDAIATGDDALARAAALIINLAGDGGESDHADEQVAQTGSEVALNGSEVDLTGSEVVELTGSEVELTLPAVDATILARYFDYFIEIGFFPAPMGEQLSEVEATS